MPRVIRRTMVCQASRYERLGNLGFSLVLVLQLVRNPTTSIPGYIKLLVLSDQLRKTDSEGAFPSESFVSG